MRVSHAGCVRLDRTALAELDHASELLDSVDWDSLLLHDVNTYWSVWKNYFMQIMEICFAQCGQG